MEGIHPKLAPLDDTREPSSLESLPKEVGVFLIVAGVGGILLPGPVGAPFLIMGGVVLFPNLFRKVDRSFANRFPRFHREGLRQVQRFVTDLERRYPSTD